MGVYEYRQGLVLFREFFIREVVVRYIIIRVDEERQGLVSFREFFIG